MQKQKLMVFKNETIILHTANNFIFQEKSCSITFQWAFVAIFLSATKKIFAASSCNYQKELTFCVENCLPFSFKTIMILVLTTQTKLSFWPSNSINKVTLRSVRGRALWRQFLKGCSGMCVLLSTFVKFFGINKWKQVWLILQQESLYLFIQQMLFFYWERPRATIRWV